MPTVADRLLSFVVERYPFALPAVQRALESSGAAAGASDQRAIEQSRPTLCRELTKQLEEIAASDLPDTTPGVTADARLQAARDELVEACDSFLIREAIAASLTDDERREILRGMILTRAVDNRLKQFFLGGEIAYQDVPFQGKGFRSLGQEAIYAAAIRLKRGEAFRDPSRGWQGDIVGPIIRDLGVALAMRPDPSTVRMVLNAQMAKSGPPMDGRDLHIGDWEWGILPATAPLSISTLSIAGVAMAFSREGHGRVALSFIGEGGSSLGEWHATALRRRKDGSKVNVDFHAMPLIVGDAFVGCLGIYQDITERVESEAKLGALRDRLTRVQDDERARIARELHDDLGQRLALLTIQLSELQQSSLDVAPALAEQLETSRRLSEEICVEANLLSHRLHPSRLAHIGLANALSRLCDELAQQGSMDIDFHHDEIPDLPSEVTTCLYRVAQEAIRNAEKHSGSRRVRVGLAARSDSIRLCVSDSGRGFAATAAECSTGLGLVSMAERVRSLGGALSVQSEVNRGTHIEASIPMPPAIITSRQPAES